jgi:hypothetical protein
MGAWLFDFIAAICKRIAYRDTPLGTVARDAYTEGLAPHHNWLLRSAASIGLAACVTRE